MLSMNPNPENSQKISLQKAIDIYKSFEKERAGKKPGAVNKNTKGMTQPDGTIYSFYGSGKGIREKIKKVDFSVLREIARKVTIVASIHQTRIQQLRPFCFPAFSEEDAGFMIRLKEREKTPNSKQKKTIEEINKFLYHTGYLDFEGSDEREDRFPQVISKLTREQLTIDQIAIEIQRNKKGEMIAFHAMDGSTIKRTFQDKGYEGKTDIKYVQEIQGKVFAEYEKKDLLFYCHNPRTDILFEGYGYSPLEQSLDILTAWLFGMQYNMEVFNNSAMPKGFLSFAGQNIDQGDLEELQREWTAMFSGIEGMWKTPFLQYDAKWQNMAPSNRDMEWNTYIQLLSSLICSVHGIDPMEMGLRFNQAQNVLNENQEKKIAYSKDRGLKDLLFFHQAWVNRILEYNEEWEEFKFEFSGFESPDQEAELRADKMKIESFMTINELRKEKDMKPIENGDIILNPQFIQVYQSAQQQQQDQGGGEGGEGMPGGEGEGEQGGEDDFDFSQFGDFSNEEIEGAGEQGEGEDENSPEEPEIKKSNRKIVIDIF